ncbi:MAG: CHRD domain-containing protein [Streptosporangiaceae bacterium]
MIFAADRRRRASHRGRHRAPVRKSRYSAGRLGVRTSGLLVAATAMAAAAPADAGAPGSTAAPAVVRMVLHPMPAGTVSFGRSGGHRLTAQARMFGLTPGSSHAVDLVVPGRGLVKFSTLTASSVGQADASLTSRFTGQLASGSHLVIRMGTQASGVGTEPIATTAPLRRGGGPHRLIAVEVTTRGVNYGTPHGQATMTYNSSRQRLTVTVSASGVSPGPHAAHIHLGSCMSQGPVAYMLKDLMANRHGRIVHAVRVFTGVKNPIPPTGWYLNIHQGNSSDILSNGQPTIYFRPLICANVRTTGISAILKRGDVVTGVRGTSQGQVVLTGGQATGSGTQNDPFLFQGPLAKAAGAAVSVLTPPFPQVTSATFYGPDTHRFNPAMIRSGQVRAVGSYQSSAAQAGVVNQGMIYLGPVSGTGGSWTSISVPPDGYRTTGHRRACPRARLGCFVMDTIPHSTMGDLVVGDYDLNPAGPGALITANAFIYNLSTRRWTLVDLGHRMSDQTTLYGIWQDGGPHSPRFTLVGGSFASGHKRGFLMTYNEVTGAFGRPAFYSFGNRRALVTHFEGITAVPGGFHVVAVSSRHLASMAFIPVLAGGSFGTARWYPVQLRASALCAAGCSVFTGNTVYQNKVMGLYLAKGAAAPSTYLADIATRH